MAEFQGNGTTIAWASGPTGLFAEIVNISFSGRTKGTIDVSTFATTGSMKKIMHALDDPGVMIAEILFAPSIDPDAIMAATGSVVITHSDGSGKTWTADAGCSSLSGELPYHERATQTVELTFLGGTTLAP